MNDELTNLTNIPAPTLTLDPVVEDTAVKASIVEVEAPPAPSLADGVLHEGHLMGLQGPGDLVHIGLGAVEAGFQGHDLVCLALEQAEQPLGRQRLAEVREGELAALAAKAQASASTEDAEAVQKLSAACNRFEKKLSDLDLSRTVATRPESSSPRRRSG